MVALFSTTRWETLAFFAALLLTLIAGSRIAWGYFLRGLRPILAVAILTILFNAFFASGPRLETLPISEPGLERGLLVAARLVLLVALSSLLTLTTRPLELVEAIETALSPFRLLGLPVNEAALLTLLSFRFLPILALETERVIQAQTARGAYLDSGNLRQRLIALRGLLIPLFVRALSHAGHIAEAMEARCYRGPHHRTRRKSQPLGWLDIAFVTVMAALLATPLAYEWGLVG